VGFAVSAVALMKIQVSRRYVYLPLCFIRLNQTARYIHWRRLLNTSALLDRHHDKVIDH